MNNIFQKIGLSLIVLGIGFYIISDSGSITALIPSFLGAIVCGFVFLAGKFPNQHRHFAHANLAHTQLFSESIHGHIKSEAGSNYKNIML